MKKLIIILSIIGAGQTSVFAQHIKPAEKSETALIVGNNTEGVSISPNPSSTGVFEITVASIEKKRLEVFTSSGEMMIAKQFASSKTQVDLSSYGTGTYTMKITSGNVTLIKQLTVAK